MEGRTKWGPQNLFTEEKQTHSFQNQSCGSHGENQGRGGPGAGPLGAAHTHGCRAWLTDQNLLYGTGVSSQEFVLRYMGEKNGDDR